MSRQILAQMESAAARMRRLGHHNGFGGLRLGLALSIVAFHSFTLTQGGADTMPPILQAAVNGLFSALSSWQMAALHLELMSSDQGRLDAEPVQHNLPKQPRLSLLRGEASRLRQTYAEAARRLIALPARAPSPRLLADQAAEVLAGISRVLEGLVLLVDGPVARRDRFRQDNDSRVHRWPTQAGRGQSVIA